MKRSAFLAAVFLAAAASAPAQTWRAMGPPGGDVRALAADPQDPRRLYLGTSDGHVFASRDGGARWELAGRAGSRTDSVITVILVDPRDSDRLFAAAWLRDPAGGGGLYRSDDGGRTWEPAGLAGQAVRALAQAPSNPDVLIAGSLDGVYRSRDAARTWQRISPEGHEEIRNLDSIAIDPRDPDTIYIGTFHLPWKTTDGGRRWTPIHDGMIDDSDVMSILVDRSDPRRIYASACSGIYRSDNAGALWRKIQGIPYSARRTYVIRQDPARPEIVYAGTSEGLWKTATAGASWQRLTPRDWVINALVVDAARPDRLVVGTERLGVLLSDDGGMTFRAANEGFNHRQIAALALDRQRPGRVLAVLANAPEPVMATDDGGQTWSPLGPGLAMQGLLRVYASPDGWWAALERGGLVRYDAARRKWAPAGVVAGEAAATADRRGRARGPAALRLRVDDMAFSRDAWFAATEQGLLASRDQGRTWALFPFAPMHLPVSSVRASPDGRRIWIVSLRGMVFSRDAGENWTWHDLPFGSGGALRLEIAEENTLVALARKGLYVSRDAGKTWQPLQGGLPQQVPLQDLAVGGDFFLASLRTGGLYLSTDQGRSWSRIEGHLADGFFPAVVTGDAASVIFAASASEGLYAIEMDASSQAQAAGGQPD